MGEKCSWKHLAGYQVLDNTFCPRWGQNVWMGLGIALSLARVLYFPWRRKFPHPELPVWAEGQAGTDPAASTAVITPFLMGAHGYPLLGLLPRRMNPKTTHRDQAVALAPGSEQEWDLQPWKSVSWENPETRALSCFPAPCLITPQPVGAAASSQQLKV